MKRLGFQNNAKNGASVSPWQRQIQTDARLPPIFDFYTYQLADFTTKASLDTTTLRPACLLSTYQVRCLTTGLAVMQDALTARCKTPPDMAQDPSRYRARSHSASVRMFPLQTATKYCT